MLRRHLLHLFGTKLTTFKLRFYFLNFNCSSYNAADESGLFKHLNYAAHEDKVISEKFNIANLFGSWSNQKGFPLVTLIRNENGSITLHQGKYNAYATNETDTSSWWIPFNLATAQNAIFNKTLPSGWMAKGEQTKLLTVSNDSEIKWGDNDWVILNRQQTGYYRVQYDEKNYNLIMKELNDGDPSKIHPINRAQIIDDIHELVLRERVSAKHLCHALNYLSKENAYAPWQAANKILDDWHHNFQTSKKLKSFQLLIGNSVGPYYDQLTINEADDEPILNKVARSIAINLACEYGVSKCLQETYTEFQAIINGKKIKPNIRQSVIFNGIRSANDEEITKLWSIFLNIGDKVERSEIILSLGNIARDATLNEYLKKSTADFNDKTLDATERTNIITTIAGRSQKGLMLAIQFLATDLENVQKITGSVPSILHSIGRYILTVETETKVKSIQTPNDCL